ASRVRALLQCGDEVLPQRGHADADGGTASDSSRNDEGRQREERGRTVTGTTITEGVPLTTPTTMPAITHVAVTVTDLAVREPWCTTLLGVGPGLDEDPGPFRHIVYQLGSTLLGLHGFPDLHSKEPFDERTPGLDHISFGVATRAELEQWAQRLDELGVPHG